MPLTRRTFLASSGAIALPFLLASCGFAPATTPTRRTGTLTFTTWGTDAELGGFRNTIAAFEAANDGVTVELNAVPYGDMFTNIDAQLQAGNPPDVFRVPYYFFGKYAGGDQLLDLSATLASGTQDQFTETAWAAVNTNGSPFGVPHHTDTSCILINTTLAAQAGLAASDIPTSVDDAWTWDQLTAVGNRMKAALPEGTYPWAYNWQGNGVTRWLSLLFQNDGAFLESDQKTPAIDSDAARGAVEFSQSFFTNGFVPANDTISSSSFAADSWFSQTVAMVWSGAFQIPDADSTAGFEWTATFAPRNVRGGGDFGGNALVVTKGTADPALATAFLEFATQADQMRDFCSRASLLPTRSDLLGENLTFDVRPELAPIWAGQAAQVEAQDVAQVASPSMSAIIPVLKEQLDLAFTGAQDAATTVANLQTGIAAATGA